MRTIDRPRSFKRDDKREAKGKHRATYLHASHPLLEDQRPRDVALTEVGARRVESLAVAALFHALSTISGIALMIDQSIGEGETGQRVLPL